MTGLEMDFHCLVSPKYELRRPDELEPIEYAKRTIEYGIPNVRYLVAVGPGKLVRPRRQALDMAIGLLLKTRMPKWRAAIEKLNVRPAHIDPDELAMLERNALAISRHIGLLDVMPHLAKDARFRDPKRDRHESLFWWFQLANRIQTMFEPAERKAAGWRFDTDEGLIGKLGVFISWGEPSLSIRPDTTLDALVYHAAQMITAGTKFHTCEHCKAPFLGGGAGHGRNKKRADARFCSDACRWGYHNASRRKTRSKSKS